MRNVEYLGMRTRIKVFLGRWYASWNRSRLDSAPPVVCEEESDEPRSLSGEDMRYDDDSEEDDTDSEAEDGSDYDTEDEDEDDNLMSEADHVNMRMAYTLRCLDKSQAYSSVTLDDPPRGRPPSRPQQFNASPEVSPLRRSPSRS